MNRMNCHIQVVFETGLDLDTQELILAGYRPVAARVAASMLSDGDEPAATSPDRSRLSISARTRRGSPLVPAWFTDVPLAIESPVQDSSESGVELAVERCVLRFFDYGVAIVLLDGAVTSTVGSTAGSIVDLVRAVELFSDDIPDRLVAAATERVAQLRTAVLAVKNTFLIDDVLSRELRQARDGGDGPTSRVRALWVHRILGISTVPSPSEFHRLNALDSEHAATFGSDEGGRFQFFPGQGTSLVVSPSAGIPAEVSEPLALLNAYYAGSTKYDEAVFSGISQLQAISRGRGRYGARAKADEILAMQERVLLFRATVDHQAHNLSPQEQIVWQHTSSAWNLQPLIDGVASNAATLDRLFQHVAESRRFEQAQRLSFIITIFTAASILGVGAALFPIVDQEPAHLPVVQRLEVFASLVFIPLLTIGFVSMLIWQARRVRR